MLWFVVEIIPRSSKLGMLTKKILFYLFLTVYYRYLKLLIQEMDLKIDQGFIYAMVIFFTSTEEVSDEEEKKIFEDDCKQIESGLLENAIRSTEDENKNFFDNLHFSPLKIHLSFSMSGSTGSEEETKSSKAASDVLKIFVQSVGMVFSDIQDVVLK